MHEVSIVQGLLDIVIEHCKKEGFKTVDLIKIKVGKASGVVPESLLFAFDTMKIGTIAENANLLIDEVPVTGFCENCKNHFTVEEAYIISCPICGERNFREESGRELNIYEMEVN